MTPVSSPTFHRHVPVAALRRSDVVTEDPHAVAHRRTIADAGACVRDARAPDRRPVARAQLRYAVREQPRSDECAVAGRESTDHRCNGAEMARVENATSGGVYPNDVACAVVMNEDAV